VARMWNSVCIQTREALECSKQNCLGDDVESSDDQKTDRNVESKHCTHEISDGNESSQEWNRRHPCYIAAMNFYTFSLCADIFTDI
jgi:hypothetical protein